MLNVTISPLSIFGGGSSQKAFSLVLIGAHSGEKSFNLVQRAARRGKVCLVEPVPSLMVQLRQRFCDVDNIIFVEGAILPKKITDDGLVDFFSVSEHANSIASWGDQLGSLSSEHAKTINSEFGHYVENIKVACYTITDLVKILGTVKVDVLIMDTEGYDCSIIESFPFGDISPNTIVFEHKHADGTFNLASNFLSTMNALLKNNYKVKIIDKENAIANLND